MTMELRTTINKADVIGDRSQKPDHCIRVDAVPAELRTQNRWLGWQWKWNDKTEKWDKVPVNARTGGKGSSTDPKTWCSYDDALSAYRRGDCDGIGFALGAASDEVEGQCEQEICFSGIDLDDCRDPKTGELNALAHEIINMMNTYAEVSPSGTGVKLFCVGKLPERHKTKNKDRTVEIYSSGRFFTITGDRVCDFDVNLRQPELTQVFERFIGNESQRQQLQSNSRTRVLACGQALTSALEAMRRIKPNDKENDGSHRLFAVCCRAVEHELDDEATVTAVREYERHSPFPRPYSDQEILDRVRDAEHQVERGVVKPPAKNADPGQIAAEIIAMYTVDGLPTLRFWNELFWRWSNGRYVEISCDEVRAIIVHYLDENWSHVKREHINNVLEHLRAKTLLASDITSPSWLDPRYKDFDPRECLATSNRIIHLPSFADNRERFDVPATPAFFTLIASDFDVQFDAAPPKEWLKLLAEVWPNDQQSIDTLQEIFGYLLTADTRQQKMFFLVGPPRSGKGTIARVLRKLVGEDNVAGPTLSGLASNFGVSALVGRSLAIVSDARLSGRADQAVVVERLLAISGEDKLTIDRKHRAPIHCQLPTRIMILSNELPRLADASGTIISRFLVLQTTVSFLGREDHALIDKLLAELPGILLWAIEGWRRFRERGHFIQPNDGCESLDAMTALASPVKAFVAECCEHDTLAAIAVPDLYDAYQAWCNSQGQRHVSNKQTFGRDLRAAYPKLRLHRPSVSGNRTRFYQGIKLITEPEG